jgi:hypothetical protein
MGGMLQAGETKAEGTLRLPSNITLAALRDVAQQLACFGLTCKVQQVLQVVYR